MGEEKGSEGMAKRGDLGEHVRELRRLLRESADLSKIIEYFDEELVSDDEFIERSEFEETGAVVAVICGLVKVVKGEHEATDQRALVYAEQRLWHGMVMFQGGVMAQYLYFEDENRGCCAVVEVGREECEHLRFSIPGGIGEALEERGVKFGSIAIKGRGGLLN